MRFGIGSDLGVNLLKGVIFSFISVMVFMPALTLLLYKAIDGTRHRKLMPAFKSSGSFIMKIRIPFLILALVIAIPTFLAQSKTEFLYGMGNMTDATRVGDDTKAIDDKFGKENPLILLVPKENAGKEEVLCEELSLLPYVKASPPMLPISAPRYQMNLSQRKHMISSIQIIIRELLYIPILAKKTLPLLRL